MSNYRQRAKTEKEFFDRMAKNEDIYWGYRSATGKYRFKLREEIARKTLDFKKGKTILDLGCGYGDFCGFLGNQLLTVHAVDVSPKAIAVAKKKFKNIKFGVQDAHHLRFSDNYFDIVMGNSTLHHLDLRVALPEIYRVLKPGGDLFFIEPNLLNPQVFLEKTLPGLKGFQKNTPDETAIVRWQLSHQLKKVGFKKVNIRPFDFIYPIIPYSIMIKILPALRFLENIPIIKEVAGSLIIKGQK